MLSTRQVSARKRVEKKSLIARLEKRLDRHVISAEKLHSGETKRLHMAEAEKAREYLRAIDH